MTFDELGRLVKGKRIAALGRAGYLLKGSHSWKGEYIDDHDIVARCNNVYPYGSPENQQNANFIDPKLYKFLGARTNFHYVSCSIQRDDINEQSLRLFVQDGGIAICSAESSKARTDYQHVIPLIESITNYHKIPDDIYRKMNHEHFRMGGIKTSVCNGKTVQARIKPVVGIQMLKELLMFDVKSISVMGFTCCFDDIDTRIRLVLEKHPFHRIEIDLLWLRRTREKDSRLVFDDTLERVLTQQKGLLDEIESRLDTNPV